jgi:hypothetical protein
VPSLCSAVPASMPSTMPPTPTAAPAASSSGAAVAASSPDAGRSTSNSRATGGGGVRTFFPEDSSSSSEPGGEEEADEYDEDGAAPADYGGTGGPITVPRKKKRRLTEEQIHSLSIARDQKGITGKKVHMQARLTCAAEIGLPESAVRNWLNNHKRKRGHGHARNQQFVAAQAATTAAAAAVASSSGLVPPSSSSSSYSSYPSLMSAMTGMNAPPGMTQMEGAWGMQAMLTTPSQPTNLTNFFLSQPNQFNGPTSSPTSAAGGAQQQQSNPYSGGATSQGNQYSGASGVQSNPYASMSYLQQGQQQGGGQYAGSYPLMDLQQQHQQQALMIQQNQAQLQSYANEWPPSYSPAYSSAGMSTSIPNTFELGRRMSMSMPYGQPLQQYSQHQQPLQQQPHYPPAQNSRCPQPLSSTAAGAGSSPSASDPASASSSSFDPTLIPLLQKKLLEQHASHTAAVTRQAQATQMQQDQDEILQKIEAITRYNLTAAKSEEPPPLERPNGETEQEAAAGSGGQENGRAGYMTQAHAASLPLPPPSSGPTSMHPALASDAPLPSCADASSSPNDDPAAAAESANLCDSLRAQIRSLQAKLNEVFEKQHAFEQQNDGVKQEGATAGSSASAAAASGQFEYHIQQAYMSRQQIQFQHPAHPAYNHYSQPGLLTSNVSTFLGVPSARSDDLPPLSGTAGSAGSSGQNPTSSPMSSFLRVPSVSNDLNTLSGTNSRRNSSGDVWSNSPGMTAQPGDEGELLFDKALLDGFFAAEQQHSSYT